MTTKNVNGINAARMRNKDVATSAVERASKLVANQTDIDQQLVDDKRNAEIAARAMEQEANDNKTDIGHELAQLNFILNGVMAPEPAPVVEPAAPVVVVEAAPEPAPVVEPAAPVVVVEAAPEPAPVVEPAAPVVVVEAAPVVENRFTPNPINWDWIQWLLALIGALIGAIVARMSMGFLLWVANNPTNDWVKNPLVVAWYIALIAVGFFGGGLLGHWLGNRQRVVAVAE